MSCQIIHCNESGQEIARYWVEKPILRIGSDPGCHIVIPGLSPHALTLQFRDGAYCLINRGKELLEIDGHSVAPQAVAAWPEEAGLRFVSGITLRLVFPDGDPTPASSTARRPYYELEEPDASELVGSHDSEPPVDDEEEPTSPMVSAKSIKDAVQLGVTVVAISAGVLLLVFQDRLGSPNQKRDLAPFATIVDGLIDLEEQDPTLIHVRTALQDARRHQVAARIDSARADYQRVRDLLLQRAVRLDPIEFANQAERQAYEYALEHAAISQGGFASSH